MSSFISIDLDPITLCDDFKKRVIEGGFNEIIIWYIKSEYVSKSKLYPKEMVNTWNIRLETARKTIQDTTNLVPRNTTNVTFNSRYQMND